MRRHWCRDWCECYGCFLRPACSCLSVIIIPWPSRSSWSSRSSQSRAPVIEVVADAWPRLLEALHSYSPHEPGDNTGDTSSDKLSSSGNYESHHPDYRGTELRSSERWLARSYVHCTAWKKPYTKGVVEEGLGDLQEDQEIMRGAGGFMFILQKKTTPSSSSSSS